MKLTVGQLRKHIEGMKDNDSVSICVDARENMVEAQFIENIDDPEKDGEFCGIVICANVVPIDT